MLTHPYMLEKMIALDARLRLRESQRSRRWQYERRPGPSGVRLTLMPLLAGTGRAFRRLGDGLEAWVTVPVTQDDGVSLR